jgi:hypothetical protein
MERADALHILQRIFKRLKNKRFPVFGRRLQWQAASSASLKCRFASNSRKHGVRHTPTPGDDCFDAGLPL